ncbi:MAG: ankyrin repeat domain-containing protein [Nitrospira sp.]|nr:ankyrin repeat domain-containing protein [Nitrospira sp.]
MADGAVLRARDGRGRTALMAATYQNHVESAGLLIQAGADVNAQDLIQNSPLLLAGASDTQAFLKLALGAAPISPSTTDSAGRRSFQPVSGGHVEVVRELLKATIDVNHVNRLGGRPCWKRFY